LTTSGIEEVSFPCKSIETSSFEKEKKGYWFTAIFGRVRNSTHSAKFTKRAFGIYFYFKAPRQLECRPNENGEHPPLAPMQASRVLQH
jgi:hypothetical protein